MHVTIIIPTLAYRWSFLQKTIETIHANTYKDLSVIIVVDGNHEMLSQVHSLQAEILFNEKCMGWIWCMNHTLKHVKQGAVLYAADDLEFDPHCIEIAVEQLETKASDTDGLVAIKQSVVGCSTAFGLLGHKFIERFPERAVFCPDYTNWGGDSELGRFARSINRLYICNESQVLHHRLKDATRDQIKSLETQDYHFIAERKKAGLLWGRDFQLLRKED